MVGTNLAKVVIFCSKFDVAQKGMKGIKGNKYKTSYKYVDIDF
jgi:hypothetical protein